MFSITQKRGEKRRKANNQEWKEKGIKKVVISWQETQVLDRTMPISTWGAATFKCMTIKSPPCPIKDMITSYDRDMLWMWQATQVIYRTSLQVPEGLHHLSAWLSKAKLDLSKKRWNKMFLGDEEKRLVFKMNAWVSSMIFPLMRFNSGLVGT